MLCIFDGVVYDISQRFRCPFEVEYSKSIGILQSQRQSFFRSLGGILFYYLVGNFDTGQAQQMYP